MQGKIRYREDPILEITLRKYEKPSLLEKRELVKKLCLSLGLLNPGDSRDIIVDILFVLLEEKKELESEEIRESVIDTRKKYGLEPKGVASSNIRRQLRRLRDIYLIERKQNRYRINECLNLKEIFEKKIKTMLLNQVLERIKEYVNEVDKKFELNRNNYNKEYHEKLLEERKLIDEIK